VPDLIVDGKVIADPKVVSVFHDTHIAQMLGYLNITDLEVALLLNFKEATLTWEPVPDPNMLQINRIRVILLEIELPP
jgi:GxxExxY protein